MMRKTIEEFVKNEINSNRFYSKLTLFFSILGIILAFFTFKHIAMTANFLFMTKFDDDYYELVSRIQFFTMFSVFFGPITLFQYWKRRFKPPENLPSESPIPTLILILYVIFAFICYLLPDLGLYFSGLILIFVLYQVYILLIPFCSKTEFTSKAYIYISLSLILSLFPMFIRDISLSVPAFLVGQFYMFKSFVLLTLVFIYSFFPLHRKKKRLEKLEKVLAIILLMLFNAYIDTITLKQASYYQLLSGIYPSIVFYTEIIFLIFSIITIYWSSKATKQNSMFVNE